MNMAECARMWDRIMVEISDPEGIVICDHAKECGSVICDHRKPHARQSECGPMVCSRSPRAVECIAVEKEKYLCYLRHNTFDGIFAEIERCRVRIDQGTLIYRRKSVYDHHLCERDAPLHEALSDPDFICFEWADGDTWTWPRQTNPKETDSHNPKLVADVPEYVLFRKR